MMSGKQRIALSAKLGLLLLLGCFLILGLAGCTTHNLGMLNPKGLVAYEERKLFYDTLALMLIVVLPVIVMSFTFIYHYQVSHRHREYKPNWSHSYFLETLWWGIPCAIIVVLSILTWKKTHELDPYQRVTGFKEAPLLIQAIALPWKWLFIYPQQNIATINYLMIPAGQQVEFWITADNVPMSALFIPQLGSQIYAMAGMRTRLHVVSKEPGEYEGMNTQFNGDGFSGMHFSTIVVLPSEMRQWFKKMKNTPQHLTEAAYKELLRPSEHNPPAFFSGVPANMFQQVVDLYMHSVGPVHPRQEIQFIKE